MVLIAAGKVKPNDAWFCLTLRAKIEYMGGVRVL